MRLYTVWLVNTYRPDLLLGDEIGYDNLARDLLRGYGFTWPGRVPLYPAWLAGVYLATNGSLTAARLAQVAWSAAILLLVYLLARRIFDQAAGLIALFLAAISYILIQQPAHLLSEILYTPVMLLATLALWEAFHKPAWQRFAVAGALIGLCNLIRPTLVLFPVFLGFVLLVYFRSRLAWQYALALLLSSTVVVLPWVARNTLRYHAVYPLATSNAFLWQGSPEYYHLVKDQGYTYLEVWEKVIYGPEGQAHDPGSVEGDRWWTQRALRSIAAEPLTYLRFCLEKALTFWIGDPSADWGDSYVFNFRALRDYGFSPGAALQYLLARSVVPLAALLAAIYLESAWRALLPVYAMLVYNTVFHALGHAEARLSEPLQPLLIIIIAGAVSVWARRSIARYRTGRAFAK